jgi:hypothetical protein
MTPHFSLSELTFSQTAVRNGIPNEPDDEQKENLSALCVKILEPARAEVGAIRVSSGFRCPIVNTLVGGSPSSQHMKGQASDLVPVSAPLRELFLWIFENAPFDQLIWEFGRWVHVSHSRLEPGRRELLAAFHVPGQGRVYRLAATPLEAFQMVRAA